MTAFFFISPNPRRCSNGCGLQWTNNASVFCGEINYRSLTTTSCCRPHLLPASSLFPPSDNDLQCCSLPCLGHRREIKGVKGSKKSRPVTWPHCLPACLSIAPKAHQSVKFALLNTHDLVLNETDAKHLNACDDLEAEICKWETRHRRSLTAASPHKRVIS